MNMPKKMLDYKLVLVACLLATFCPSSSMMAQKLSGTSTRPSNVEYPVKIITQREYNQSRPVKRRFLIQGTPVVTKHDGRLALPLDKGSTVLKDTFDQGELTTEYTYVGYLPQFRRYVLRVTYLNDEDVLLVDKASGHMARMWSEPVLAGETGPMATMKMPSSDGDYGVQVWEYVGGSLVKTVEINSPSGWYPLEVKWQDARTLLIKAESGMHNAAAGHGYEYLKLELHQAKR